MAPVHGRQLISSFLFAGDSLGGKATAIGNAVNPGQTADISVVLTSTSATGTITGTWRLSNDKCQPFGTQLTVVIKNGITTTATGGACNSNPNSNYACLSKLVTEERKKRPAKFAGLFL